MSARPKSVGATIASLLVAASAVLTAVTGLPPLGATQPPFRHAMAVLLAANMLWIGWGTLRLDATAWLCAMLLYGALGAFTAATLIVGPRAWLAWTHLAMCAAILGCLALPSVRAAFRRARAISGVVPTR
jgi:hypothetical protein